jgi:hypothetical protein
MMQLLCFVCKFNSSSHLDFCDEIEAEREGPSFLILDLIPDFLLFWTLDFSVVDFCGVR